MSKDKIQATFMNIGASSLLVIFIVLCIALFATLSLSSAKSDYSFSEKIAQHKTDYYDASNTSEQILAEIDAALAGGTPVDSLGADSQWLPEELRDISITITPDSGQPTASWQVPIDDTQALSVVITLYPQGGSEGYYTIKSWQATAIQ